MSYYSDIIVKDNPIVYYRLNDGLDVSVVVDGSFEDNGMTMLQTRWYLAAVSEMSLDMTTDNFYAGTTSLKCTTTRTAVGWSAVTQGGDGVHVNSVTSTLIPTFSPVAINPNQAYNWSFWYKQTAGAKQTHMKVLYLKSDGITLSAIRTTDFVLSGTDGLKPWTLVSGTYTPPSDAVYAVAALMYGYWDGVTGSNAQIWFDNVEGRPFSTAYESRGNGPNGTLNKGVTTGQAGATTDGNQAMAFDGTGYVVVPPTAALSAGILSWSLEAWIKRPANDLVNERIIYEHDVWGNTGTYQLTVQAGSVLCFNFPALNGAGKQVTYVPANMNNNQWHHVVGKLDVVAQTATLYWDGNQVAQSTGVTMTIGSSTTSLWIGSRGGTTNFWSGSLDEIGIYGYALTLDQVRTHYNAASVAWSAPINSVTTDKTLVTTLPPSIDLAVTEILPCKLNVGGYIVGNDSIGNLGAITAKLFLVSTGLQITTAWLGTITTSGNVITIPITCSVLQLGQTYQLVVTFPANFQKTCTSITYFQIVA